MHLYSHRASAVGLKAGITISSLTSRLQCAHYGVHVRTIEHKSQVHNRGWYVRVVRAL